MEGRPWLGDNPHDITEAVQAIWWQQRMNIWANALKDISLWEKNLCLDSIFKTELNMVHWQDLKCEPY